MGDDLTRPRQRLVAVVQARMSSTRLPGKVLAPLGAHSALELVVHRLRRSRELDEIVLATSTDPSDDPVAVAGVGYGLGVVRGPLDDVLARYLQACEFAQADAVVRITADCPLIDPEIVDLVCEHWRARGLDYVTNTLEPRSFPDGLDVEVISAPALRRIAELASTQEEREHVTVGIRRRPSQFTFGEVRLDPPLGSVRITLDTPEDLELLRRLVDTAGADAAMDELLEALGVDADPTISTVP